MSHRAGIGRFFSGVGGGGSPIKYKWEGELYKIYCQLTANEEESSSGIR